MGQEETIEQTRVSGQRGKRKTRKKNRRKEKGKRKGGSKEKGASKELKSIQRKRVYFFSKEEKRKDREENKKDNYLNKEKSCNMLWQRVLCVFLVVLWCGVQGQIIPRPSMPQYMYISLGEVICSYATQGPPCAGAIQVILFLYFICFCSYLYFICFCRELCMVGTSLTMKETL